MTLHSLIPREAITRAAIAYCFKKLRLRNPGAHVFCAGTYVPRRGPDSFEDVVVGNGGMALHRYSSDPRERHSSYNYPDLETFLRAFVGQRIEWHARAIVGKTRARPPTSGDVSAWQAHLASARESERDTQRMFLDRLDAVLRSKVIQWAQIVLFGGSTHGPISAELAIVGEWQAGGSRYIFVPGRITMIESERTEQLSYTVLSAIDRNLKIKVQLERTGLGYEMAFVFDRTYKTLQSTSDFWSVPQTWRRINPEAAT